MNSKDTMYFYKKRIDKVLEIHIDKIMTDMSLSKEDKIEALETMKEILLEKINVSRKRVR